jgi:hypothetical protein
MIWTRRKFLRTAAIGSLFPLAGKLLPSSAWAATSAEPGDSVLLDQIERAAFDYFWTEADPHTGLVKDRANADGGDSRKLASIAATGFGLTALCIAHQRGYGSPHEITDRVRKTLHFLAHEAPHNQGFLYHFIDIHSGHRSHRSEVSTVDMAILLCGALTCRQYFQDKKIAQDATELYERIDWNWALNGGDTFPMEWTPEYGFGKFRWDSYCESMMLYLLAIGSPSHRVPVQTWHSIRRPWMVYDKYRFISSPAPLFVHQYSHAWFDFRGKEDDYANYFENSVLASRAHRKFCQQLSQRFPSYSRKVWGITASDSSRGYVAWGGPPLQGPIDGTIVPAASAGSLPFLYSEALTVLENLRESYGADIWKRYGFVDAFNPMTGWVSSDVVGIDVGITMVMAENARSQFVWNTFMRNREAKLAMEQAGFHAPGPYNPEYALASAAEPAAKPPL